MEQAWISMGAIFAFLGFFQGLLGAFMPYELSHACKRLGVRIYHSLFTAHVDFIVEELDGGKRNQLYDAVQLHLSDKAAAHARRLLLTQPKHSSALTCSLGEHEVVQDVYEGTKVWWEFTSSKRTQGVTIAWRAMPDTLRSLHMRIHRKDRDKIMSGYVLKLLENAKALKLKRRDRLLYTNVKHRSDDWYSGGKVWDSVSFQHPATFNNLALEPAFKKKIMDDLTDFASGEQFYKDTGRAWKRGYLLYGPPGTGKSSMVAAMANFLEYDVYDLELTEVKSNAALRSLLLEISDKAIVVLEDIDCSLDLSERRKKKKKKQDIKDGRESKEEEEEDSKVTLSGLLNFTDGLWSSCGNERIFVFTTNHIEKLDAALLRSGRMDMHIHLSYCGFEAFKVLAKNYLKLEEHALFEDVQAVMQEEGVRMTPADVSEVMTREKRDPEQALHCLIKELRESKLRKKELGQKKEESMNGEEELEKEVTSSKGKIESILDDNNKESILDKEENVDLVEGKGMVGREDEI